MISGSADTPSSSAITSPMLRVKAVPGYSPNGLQMRGGSPPSSSSTPANIFGEYGVNIHNMLARFRVYVRRNAQRLKKTETNAVLIPQDPKKKGARQIDHAGFRNLRMGALLH